MAAPQRYRENTDDGPVIHCAGPDGNDYTLCGYALEGACLGDEDEACVAVNRGKINCERCLRIIRFCKPMSSLVLAKDKP